ncbi:MAG: hypothetical protein HQL30_12555, partial [Candidatus Omnitrophica bacterium]|nr:hypothetical protein [Candidatus Omnitrophota bacterium]
SVEVIAAPDAWVLRYFAPLNTFGPRAGAVYASYKYYRGPDADDPFREFVDRAKEIGAVKRFMKGGNTVTGARMAEDRAAGADGQAELDPAQLPMVQNGLMDKLFAGYKMAMKAVINPDDRDIAGLYGGAGADVSGFFLLTNAAHGNFVGLETLNMEVLKELVKGEWWERHAEEDMRNYLGQKMSFGYGSAAQGGMVSVEAKVALELKLMGVDPKTIKFGRGRNANTISFDWKYHPSSPGPAKKRTLTFISADMRKPEEYPAQLRRLKKKVDVYLEQAAREMPMSYGSYLPEIAAYLTDGGVVALDTMVASELKRYDPLPFLGQSGRRVSTIEAPADAKKYAADLASLVWASDGYGWQLSVYRIAELLPRDVQGARAAKEAEKSQAGFGATTPVVRWKGMLEMDNKVRPESKNYPVESNYWTPNYQPVRKMDIDRMMLFAREISGKSSPLVVEFGAGSAFQSYLLARSGAVVVAVERDAELVEKLARKNNLKKVAWNIFVLNNEPGIRMALIAGDAAEAPDLFAKFSAYMAANGLWTDVDLTDIDLVFESYMRQEANWLPFEKALSPKGIIHIMNARTGVPEAYRDEDAYPLMYQWLAPSDRAACLTRGYWHRLTVFAVRVRQDVCGGVDAVGQKLRAITPDTAGDYPCARAYLEAVKVMGKFKEPDVWKKTAPLVTASVETIMKVDKVYARRSLEGLLDYEKANNDEIKKWLGGRTGGARVSISPVAAEVRERLLALSGRTMEAVTKDVFRREAQVAFDILIREKPNGWPGFVLELSAPLGQDLLPNGPALSKQPVLWVPVVIEPDTGELLIPTYETAPHFRNSGVMKAVLTYLADHVEGSGEFLSSLRNARPDVDEDKLRAMIWGEWKKKFSGKKWISSFFEEKMAPMRHLAQTLGLRAGDEVLEAGIGWELTFEPALAAAERKAHVTALEPNDALVQVLNDVVRKERVFRQRFSRVRGRVNIMAQDVRKIPRDGSYEASAVYLFNVLDAIDLAWVRKDIIVAALTLVKNEGYIALSMIYQAEAHRAGFEAVAKELGMTLERVIDPATSKEAFPSGHPLGNEVFVYRVRKPAKSVGGKQREGARAAEPEHRGAQAERFAAGDLDSFFRGLTRSFRPSELLGARIALAAEDNKAYVFKATDNGQGQIAFRAHGLKDVVIDPKARPELKGSSLSSISPDGNELAIMHKLAESAVDSHLEGISIDRDALLITELDLATLPDSNTDHFTDYARYLLSAIAHAHKTEYGKRVLFELKGRNGLDKLNDLIEEEGIKDLFIEASHPEYSTAKRIKLAPPTSTPEKNKLNIPVTPLEEGDIPAFRALLKLAIYSGSIKDPKLITDNFCNAYSTLAGKPIDKADLILILSLNPTPDILLRCALNPITRLNIDKAIRFFKTMTRQLSQSA